MLTLETALQAEILGVKLPAEAAAVVSACFTTRGPNAGQLRESKPFASAKCRDGQPDAIFRGRVNYVWRMLCFAFYGRAPHCCMPVTADFDLQTARPRIRYGQPGYDIQTAGHKAEIAELDAIVKAVEKTLPVTAQAGFMVWARVLGKV